jgi:iron(III) transport system ATP-binding protein
VTSLVKHFGNVPAVNEVSFDVRSGEIVSLLGPSGCGKTTTLRMIAGLERPDSGEIIIGDSLVSAPLKGVFVAPEKRGLGMVFQSYALWPHMTVFDNVAYPLKVRGRRGAEIAERVMRTLDMVGLSGMAHRPAPLLSGGQQQRVALARALVFEPAALLLDEPLSNLDARMRDEMRFHIKDVQDRVRVTALYVTHDQEEAMVLSDQVIVMNRGRIEQHAIPEAVFSEPASRFVMDFLGRINYLPARIVGVEATRCEFVVPSAGDARLALETANRFAIGDAVVLAVRQEGVKVIEPHGDPTWCATVQAVGFLGNQVQYRLGLGTEVVRAVMPANPRFATGTTVRIELDLNAVRLWPLAPRGDNF